MTTPVSRRRTSAVVRTDSSLQEWPNSHHLHGGLHRLYVPGFVQPLIMCGAGGGDWDGMSLNCPVRTVSPSATVSQ